MLKRLIAIVILGLALTTFVSYAFAQCNAARQTKEQKVACCQCCCCKCAQ